MVPAATADNSKNNITSLTKYHETSLNKIAYINQYGKSVNHL